MFAMSWVRDDRMRRSARRWKLQFLTLFSTHWSNVRELSSTTPKIFSSSVVVIVLPAMMTEFFGRMPFLMAPTTHQWENKTGLWGDGPVHYAQPKLNNQHQCQTYSTTSRLSSHVTTYVNLTFYAMSQKDGTYCHQIWCTWLPGDTLLRGWFWIQKFKGQGDLLETEWPCMPITSPHVIDIR